MKRRRWKYRALSSSVLRAYLRTLSTPGFRWLFSEQIAEIELELLARDLESIAEGCSAQLCAWVEGWQ